MRTFGLSTLLLVILAPLASLAAGPGIYLTLQDTSDADLGVGPGVKYTLDLPEIFYLDARLSWMHYQEIDLDIVPAEVTGGIRAQVAERWQARLGVGVGFYHFEADRGDLDDDIGYQIYAGADYEYNDDVALFAELRWRSLEADADAAFVAAEGTSDKADLDGIGLNVGLSFRY